MQLINGLHYDSPVAAVKERLSRQTCIRNMPLAITGSARDGFQVDDGTCFCSSSIRLISFCFGADVAPDAPVGVVEEADDGGLSHRYH